MFLYFYIVSLLYNIKPVKQPFHLLVRYALHAMIPQPSEFSFLEPVLESQNPEPPQ